MDGTWTCDACGWHNPGVPLCERCGQALHFQLDPPVDVPRSPSPSMLPEFWSTLLWFMVTLIGAVLILAPGARLPDLPWYWLLVHLFVFGGAAVSSLNRLMFRLWFHRIELLTPAHARSGTMLRTELHLLPFETLEGVHVTLSFRELRFNTQGNLSSRVVERIRLNSGARLRGRREHRFLWELPAPTPLGRYMHLGTEIQVSMWRFLGRFMPEIGMAAAQLRQDGGWFLQLKVRRGPFVKSIERRIVLYSPGQELLVG